MPFLGLLDKYQVEINGAGYHRIDLSSFDFRMSPPSKPGWQFTITNRGIIGLPTAKWAWKPIYYLAIYDEASDGELLTLSLLIDGPHTLRIGDRIDIQPGKLYLDSSFNQVAMA